VYTDRLPEWLIWFGLNPKKIASLKKNESQTAGFLLLAFENQQGHIFVALLDKPAVRHVVPT
jgi:hypothetical protein